VRVRVRVQVLVHDVPTLAAARLRASRACRYHAVRSHPHSNPHSHALGPSQRQSVGNLQYPSSRKEEAQRRTHESCAAAPAYSTNELTNA